MKDQLKKCKGEIMTELKMEEVFSSTSSVEIFNKKLNEISKSKHTKIVSKLRKKVLTALKKCIDPELGANLVDLGFIYGINIMTNDKNEFNVKILMTLSSQFCPMADYLISEVKEKLSKIKGISGVDVEVTFNPQWNPSMLTTELQKKFFAAWIK